ncbi:hypothetical protein [Stenotrophomonas sp. OVS01A]|nr:hypothetical protein [Stenotrophomonas sp. OVS01A]
MSMTENGSDSSSTLATLTEGNITIGGKQATAAELGTNTDASAAHPAAGISVVRPPFGNIVTDFPGV